MDRTRREIAAMAASKQFVASGGEAVRTVDPVCVFVWQVVEGDRGIRTDGDGTQNIPRPAIVISPVSVSSPPGQGLNCADDENVRVVVQILDSQPGRAGQMFQTYGDWILLIRKVILTTPNPFLQDADVNIYDPFVVHQLQRVPAEAKSLLDHEQRVALFVFQVMVRHHRQ